MTAADCCCTATRGSTPSSRDEAAAARSARPRSCSSLLGLGAAYVPARPARPARRPRLVDGRVRADDHAAAEAEGAGDRLADVRLRPGAAARRDRRRRSRPPFRARLDVPRAEPGRVPARRRLRTALLRQQRTASCSRSARRPASARGASPRGAARRCRRRSTATPSTRPSSTGRRATRTGGDGELVALCGRLRARCAGARRSARRSRRRSSHGGVVYVGDWNGRVACYSATTGRLVVDASTPSGKVKDGLALAGGPRLLRHLRLARLRAGRAHRASSSGRRRRSRGSATRARSTRRRRSPTTASTSARPTARCTRSARRRGDAALVARRPAATSTPRRRSGGSASTSAPTRARSTASTRRRATCAGRSTRTAPISGSPTVVAGRVYFATLKGRTYALDAITGHAALDASRTASTRRSSPTRSGSSSSATRRSTGSTERRSVRSDDAVRSSPAQPGSSARTSPRRSSAAGHEVVGIDCFTDYYDPALKEENARGLDVRRARPRRGRARLRRLRRRLPPRRPAGRAELRRRLPALPAPQRARVAAASSRRPPATASASSSRRRRRSTAPPSATRPRRTPQPRPLSPYGITKLACEHLAAAYAREFGLDCVDAALLQRVRAAAAPGHGVHAHRRRARRRARRSTLYGDGEQSRGWTYVADIVDATIAGDGARAAASTTSAARSRRR